MPRVTPSRVLKLLALPWIILVGLWLTLPSPSLAPGQREAYIQSTLARGGTVITAIDDYEFPPGYDWCSSFGCVALLPHWRVVSSDVETLLHLSDYDNYEPIDITKVLAEARDWNSNTIKWPSQHWVPYFSANITVDGIPSGNVEEEVNMPWFQLTDKKLFQYDMHNANARIVVRGVVPELGVVEIWRGTYADEALSVTNKDVRTETTDIALQRLAHNYMMVHENPADLLATLKVVGDHQKHVLVKGLSGRLSSRTYPIRRVLLILLGPFLLVAYYPLGLLADIIYTVAPFFPFIAIWLSCLVGLVVYRRMLEGGPISSYFGGLASPWTFVHGLIRRWRYKSAEGSSIWGPTGPVNVKTHSRWFDEEKDIGLQRLNTLRTDRGRQD